MDSKLKDNITEIAQLSSQEDNIQLEIQSKSQNPQDSGKPTAVEGARIEVVVPQEIEELHRLYVSYFRVARSLHYIIGVLGLVFSLFATSGFGGEQVSRGSALGAGICFSVLGFVDPNSRYKKCVRAARILNIASLRYKYGEISQKDLFFALELAENLVTDSEEKEITTLQSKINSQ